MLYGWHFIFIKIINLYLTNKKKGSEMKWIHSRNEKGNKNETDIETEMKFEEKRKKRRIPISNRKNI